MTSGKRSLSGSREWPVVSHHNETGTIPAPAKMAVAEDILNDPYFADLDIDLSQFSEQEKSVIIAVMQKAKVRFGENGDLDFWFEILWFKAVEYESTRNYCSILPNHDFSLFQRS